MQSKYFGEEKDNFSCILQKHFVFLASLRALLVFSLSTNCNCVNFFESLFDQSNLVYVPEK